MAASIQSSSCAPQLAETSRCPESPRSRSPDETVGHIAGVGLGGLCGGAAGALSGAIVGLIGMASGVVQEIYGMLLGHYVIRKMMFDAATAEGLAPRRPSFVNALKILRCRLAEAPCTTSGLRQWYANLLAEVAEERLPPRQDRVNPRVVKQKMSHWLKKRPIHYEFPQPTREFHRSIVMMN